MLAFLRYGPLIALLLGLLSNGGEAQILTPKVTAYSPEQLGAHNQFFSTGSLSGGRQAFGTAGKLLVHNGENFAHVPVSEGKYVVSMDKDSMGRLFIGGKSLMGALVPDSTGTLSFTSFQPLLPDSAKDFGTIWETVCDGEGGVYFRSHGRLFYYKGARIRRMTPESRFYTLSSISGHQVIEDVDTGLFSLSGKKKRFLQGTEKLAENKRVEAILPAVDPSLWIIFTQTNGLYYYDPSAGDLQDLEEREGVSAEQRFPEVRISAATRLDPMENPFGAAYAVGTRLNGIYLLGPEGAPLLNMGKDEGLPSDMIWDLEADEAGNVWAATNKGIALIHSGLPFTFAREGELFQGPISDISRGKSPGSGTAPTRSPLFLATSQGAWVLQEKEEDFYRIPESKGQYNELLFQDPVDGDPRMLIAGDVLLSTSLSPSPKRPLSADTLHKSSASDLAELPTKWGRGILQGGRDGLYVLAPSESGKGVREKLLSIKEVPEGISTVAFDEKESDEDSLRLWAGMSSKGVLEVTVDTAFREHHLTVYDTGHGLPKGQIRVFADSSVKGDRVLFGTKAGLYAFENGRFTPHCKYGRIFCDGSRQVFLLEKGSDGELWINDWRGGHIKHLIPDKEGYRTERKIFRALGLGNVRAIFPERDRIWLGCDEGLSAYFPKVRTDPEREWDCLLQEVRGAGDTLLFGGTFFRELGKGRTGGVSSLVDRVPVPEQPEAMIPTLPYSKNRVEFTFTAVFPTGQKAIEYSYKLAEFDTSWSEWTGQCRKEYTSLPEGAYTFKIKARNIYKKESRTAEYRFRILPPWYRTWTAYGGYTLAGIGLIWMIVWLNARRLMAQKERLERVVEERTKEIREKNKNLEEANETISREKEKVEEAHQEITQSIDYAQKIQEALLQSEEHFSPYLPEHFILFKPQSQVSGDFYWAWEHKGYFYIAAVDCTGHGVPGAFMSMLGISQLNEIMNTDEVLTPGYILSDLRERVIREMSGSSPESAAKDGMDAALLRIPISAAETSDPRSQNPNGELEVQFAGAQNPLYVIRKGIAEKPPSASMEYQGEVLDGDPVKLFRKTSDGVEIKGDRQPVGYDEYAKDAFSTVKLSLQKGDMLYFFSDGYADQFGGPKGKKFRYGPFKQLLASLHEKPLEEQKRELDKTFEDWKAASNQEQIDDVVVIGVRL